jgi:hypothetical protein
MAASFPTTLKTFTTKTDGVDDVQAAHVNDLQDEVAAIEAALGIGFTTPYPCEGRLTLSTGVPVTTADVLAATTLYYTPYNGNRFASYVSGKWQLATFAELSLSLAGLAANTNYDVFVYLAAGVPTLITYSWTSSGAGTSTRNHPIVLQDGVWVRNAAAHLRYLGTIRITGTIGQCEDSVTKRFVWNTYNQTLSEFNKTITGGHTYETATWRSWNANDTARVEWVCGQIADLLAVVESTQRVQGSVSAMLDATNAGSFMGSVANENAAYVRASVMRRTLVAAGYHFLQAVESGATGAVPAIVTLRGGVLG